jgi:hypothetical protein
MKDTETDKMLSDLIRDTLDNYEENYILGSWEGFVRVRRRRRKLAFWFTVTGVAASILLGWLGYRLFYSDLTIYRNDNLPEKITSLEIPVGKEIIVPGRDYSKSGNLQKTTLQPLPLSENKLQHKVTGSGTIIAELKSTEVADQAPSSLNELSDAKTKLPPDENKKNSSDSLRRYDTLNISYAEKSERNARHFPSDSSGSRSVEVQKSVDDNYFADNTKTSKIRFGVNLAPGVTSTATSSSFAYSGGISAEYMVTRSFKISTGLQVERQSVVNEANDSPSWIPAGKTQADLVDLDLPLNITWKFLNRKTSSYYLAGGVSSVVYLSQRYTTTTYIQKMVKSVEIMDGMPAVNYQIENVSNTIEEKEQAFSAFDLAGRINIIFGFEQQLKTNLFLHIEPYLKIPVSEQAAHNLHFTTSGITCKVSF